MQKIVLIFCCVILAMSAPCFSQSQADQKLSSQLNAGILFEIAHELYTWPGANQSQRDQAMVMLNSVHELDNRAEYVFPEIITLATKTPEKDYTQAVILSLQKYLRADSDLIAAFEGTKYVVNQQNTREEREAAMGLIANSIASRNPVFFSEIATELGLLYIEQAKTTEALELFNSAYSRNPYNRLAFTKFIELSPDSVSDVTAASHFRFMLQNNPLDTNAATNLANYLYGMELYNAAYAGWEYCADLYSYMNPQAPLPASIYIPWALSALRSEGNLSQCLQIAARVRLQEDFNIILEVIAADAAQKMGDKVLYQKTLDEAEANALDLQKQDKFDKAMLAWFYCFGKNDSENALAWANKAYSDEPNSQDVLAIFGYALAVNREYDLAPGYLKDLPDSQIKLLAQAKINLAKEQKPQAIEDLKKCIALDRAGIEAQQALKLIEEQGSAYISPANPAEAISQLQNYFGKNIIEKFIAPEKMLKLSIKTDGNKFSFDSDLKATLIVTNLSQQPIPINPESIFKGNILVSVKTKGDLNVTVPELLKIRIRPSVPIKAQGTLAIPLKLNTNVIREILLSYPQAGFELTIDAYIDPVTNEDGTIRNAIAALEPARTTITREPVILSDKYLQGRLKAINEGQQGQILRSVKLFSGLLAEQAAMARFEEPLYRVLYVDEPLLKSGLKKALRNDDWSIKFQVMIAIQFVPIDNELAGVLGEMIQDEKWPVRMMAIQLLANSQGAKFQKVLDWVAINDSHSLVRNMAIALGAKVESNQKK
jgi:hypothetical protein